VNVTTLERAMEHAFELCAVHVAYHRIDVYVGCTKEKDRNAGRDDSVKIDNSSIERVE
jgi:hypothetical protein